MTASNAADPAACVRPGASLFQEALGAPLSAQRPPTSHRRSPRLTDSPLWAESSGVGFLAG